MSIISTSNRKRQPKRKKFRPCTFLRAVTSRLDYGVKVKYIKGGKLKNHPVHCNEAVQIRSFLNYPQVCHLNRMNNAAYQKHFTGESTFYCAGQSDPKQPLTLVMLADIDCHHGVGTQEGAEELAAAVSKWFKEQTGYSVEFELSTSGLGMQGFGVMDKEGLDAETINGLIKRLERNLKKLLAQGDYDVSDIECKGTLPRLTWGSDRKCSNVVCGQLAKLPRDLTLIERLHNSKPLKATDLMRLPLCKEERPALKLVGLDGPKRKLSELQVGSMGGKLFDAQDVKDMAGRWSDLGAAILGRDSIGTSSRAKLRGSHMGVLLAILKRCAGKPNADGTLPHEWIKAQWDALYRSGDIKVAYSPNRVSAGLRLLSSLGLFVYDDPIYTPPTWVDGNKVKGKACKAHVSVELLALMAGVMPGDKERTGEEEEERDNLNYNKLTDSTIQAVQALTQTPADQIIRPIERLRPYYLMPDIPDNWTIAA